MKMAKVINFERSKKSNVVFNQNYIPPAKESAMKHYALHHHYDFKGFWEAPLALIQSDTNNHIFNVYVIPEVADLIKYNYKKAEIFHGETVALFVKQGIFHIKEIGRIEIVQNKEQWIVKPYGIPAEYKDIAINSIVKAGSELGLYLQTEKSNQTLKAI